VFAVAAVPDVTTVAASERRTPTEIENDRVMAGQLAVAEGARKAEQLQREAKALWEQHRERRPARMDYSRFQF
jgi:hypothetical protein